MKLLLAEMSIGQHTGPRASAAGGRMGIRWRRSGGGLMAGVARTGRSGIGGTESEGGRRTVEQPPRHPRTPCHDPPDTPPRPTPRLPPPQERGRRPAPSGRGLRRRGGRRHRRPQARGAGTDRRHRRPRGRSRRPRQGRGHRRADRVHRRDPDRRGRTAGGGLPYGAGGVPDHHLPRGAVQGDLAGQRGRLRRQVPRRHAVGRQREARAAGGVQVPARGTVQELRGTGSATTP